MRDKIKELFPGHPQNLPELTDDSTLSIRLDAGPAMQAEEGALALPRNPIITLRLANFLSPAHQTQIRRKEC